MKFLSVFFILFFSLFSTAPILFCQTSVEPTLKRNPISDFKDHLILSSEVDYEGFYELTNEVHAYRKGRLISLETFFQYADDPNTIILDTRSVGAFDGRHIEGAVNLPFSDFTTASLEKIIGDKNKRVLIYCNNNFKNDAVFMMGKMAPLALNIPTFINLYGYGYKNVYELWEMIDVKDERVNAKWKSDPDSPLARMYKARSGK